MRRATKILFFLLGLTVLIYTGYTAWLIYQHLYLTSGWAQVLGLTPGMFYAGFWATVVAAGLTALVGLGLMVRALTAPRHDRRLTFSSEGGSVQVSEEAIVSCIRAALADYPGIVESDVRLRLNNSRRKGMDVRVGCGIVEGARLDEYGQEIQTRLHKDIETLTGLAVNQVNLHFYSARPGKHTEKRQVSHT